MTTHLSTRITWHDRGWDGHVCDEGHNVEYDAAGRVVAMTLTNVRWLLDRDGEITITWPAGHVSADALGSAADDRIAAPPTRSQAARGLARGGASAMRPPWSFTNSATWT
jgi:YD repeat-containing protein